MDNQVARSMDVAACNFQIGDRVTITVHPLLAGMSGEITALPSPDAGIVALDGGGRERIPLSSLELERQALELEIEQVEVLESPDRYLERETNRLMLNEVPVGTSFNSETFNIEVIATSAPMTTAEATATVEQINQHCNQIRVLLVELEIREGYKALGFSSMKQLMLSNKFIKARSTLQKELQAGRIEKEYLNLPVGTMPERQLRPLSKLKPEYYSVALSQAGEMAGDRPLTEKDVCAVVANLLLENKSAAKRGIVEQLKEKPLFQAADFCTLGDVFTLVRLEGEQRKYNGYPCVAIELRHFTIDVDVYDTTLAVKPENLKKIDSPDVRRQLPATIARIKRLRNVGLLDRGAYSMLEHLGQQVYLTEVEESLLQCLENYYGIDS